MVRVEIDEATYEGLRRRAEECQVPLDTLLAAIAGVDAASAQVSAEVVAIIERQIREYGPVFHRLAQ